METILTDITGTIGQWLDEGFDSEVPIRVIRLLQGAYQVAANELERR